MGYEDEHTSATGEGKAMRSSSSGGGPSGAFVQIDLRDQKDLLDWLDRIEGAVDGRLLRQDVRDASRGMEAAIRGGIHSRSGLLASATRLRMGKGDYPGRYSVYVAAMASRGRFAKATAKAGHKAMSAAAGTGMGRYSVFYGRFVEYGHKIMKNGQQVGQVPGHAFAGPGFDATVDATAAAIIEKVSERIS